MSRLPTYWNVASYLTSICGQKDIFNQLGILSVSTKWLDEVDQARDRLVFPLPLDFGFGLKIDGFKGTLFPQIIESKDFTQSIEESLDRSFQSTDSLPIILCNHRAPNESDLWCQSIPQLTSPACIQQWILSVFAGEDLEWTRAILDACWNYSAEYMSLESHNDRNLRHLEGAWRMTLLSTILSRPITIPTYARQHLFDDLQILGYKNAGVLLSSSTSAVVTEATKKLLFFLYENTVYDVVEELDDRQRKPFHFHPGFSHCVIVLIIVIFCQIETAFFDGYEVTHVNDTDSTFGRDVSQLTEMDSVLMDAIDYVTYKCKESIRNADGTVNGIQGLDRYLAFLEVIEKINRDFNEGMSTIVGCILKYS